MTGPDDNGTARVKVELGSRSYEILIGPDLIATAGDHLQSVLRRPRVAIVTDATVATLHLDRFRASLDAAGIRHDAVILPPGEATKELRQLSDLLDRLLDLRVDRNTTLVALGGGVIGDIGGFAASIVLRGIDFVQVPTTLLAQVDSSVGGKTGINTRHGKNLIGSFYQPNLVLADTGALATLPPRELLAGYAEVAKYGLINDPPFFAWLESNGPRILAGDTGAVAEAVVVSCRAKAAVVAADERETGDRALLNLGHTFGHAMEAEAGYGAALLHGEAVSIGMVLAFDLSVRLGLCPAPDADRVRRHLADVGLPTRIPGNLPRDPEVYLDRMRQDKKANEGSLVFILARGIGDAFIAHDVPVAKVRDLLSEALVA